jgi:hypothetical protein
MKTHVTEAAVYIDVLSFSDLLLLTSSLEHMFDRRLLRFTFSEMPTE